MLAPDLPMVRKKVFELAARSDAHEGVPARPAPTAGALETQEEERMPRGVNSGAYDAIARHMKKAGQPLLDLESFDHSPAAEVEAMLELLAHGCTVEQVRELIIFPPKAQRELLAAGVLPSLVRRSVDFRARILAEFEYHLAKWTAALTATERMCRKPAQPTTTGDCSSDAATAAVGVPLIGGRRDSGKSANANCSVGANVKSATGNSARDSSSQR